MQVEYLTTLARKGAKKRIKVDFPLAKALQSVVQKKVKGHGTIEFAVRYENVPHFCFVCGRIWHAERECPEEVEREEGVQFGKSLCCSQQKRDVGRCMTIQAGDTRTKIGLNISGDQRAKVMSGASSSNFPSIGVQDSWHRREHEMIREVPEAEVTGLAQRVASMSVDTKSPVDNSSLRNKEQLSGMDSFGDSSDTLGNGKQVDEKHWSMHERLMLAKDKAAKTHSVLGRSRDDMTGTVMEVEKQKRMEEMGETDKKNADALAKATLASAHGISPAKTYKVSSSSQPHLTGTHDESRQAP